VAILVTRVRPPRPAADVRALRETLGFGVPAALSSFVFHAWRSVDYAVLAARLGAAPAGIYWRAYTLALDYPGKVSGIMLRLAFPLYARTESVEQMQRLRARIVRAHATALYPALVALVVLAPTLVPFLFGDPWRDAVVPAQLLAVASLFAVITTGIGPLMLAVGRARLLLALNLWNLGLYALTVFLLAPHGLNAVAIGAIGNFALSFVIVQVILHRVIGLSLRVLVADVAPAAVAGAVMLGVAAATAEALRDAGAPALVELVVVSAVGLLSYVATLRVAFRAAWTDITLLAGALLRRRLGAT
jgi:teichuronic acid exporter